MLNRLTSAHLRRPVALSSLLALTTALALTTSCGTSSDGDGTSKRAPVAVTSVFGRVTSTAGAPIAGATVTLQGRTTQTDSSGAFAVRANPANAANAASAASAANAASAASAVVNVSAPGHAPSAWTVAIVKDAANALNPVLIPYSAPVALDAAVGGTVEGPQGARLVVPAEALVDASGGAVTGTVNVHLTPLDPTVPAQLGAAPGALEARTSANEPAALESFGMIDVTVEGEAGRLQVATGKRLTVYFPAAGAAPPETVRLWSFDEDTALWLEEGTAKLEGEVYVAELPHLSFWNADEPISATCVSGRTVDATTGDPLPGARVGARGLDYAGLSSAQSGADGRWAIAVRQSSKVIVLASHADGGGQEREVQSGAVPTALPPVVGAAGCLDTGDWPVTRGVVTLADGTAVSCDSASLSSFEACIPAMVAAARCFAPSGTCSSTGLLGLSLMWSNGAKAVTTIDGTAAITTWTGPGGATCGTQRVAGNTVTVTGPDGSTETVTVSAADDGAVTYGCVNGGTRTLTVADQERLSACTTPETDACSSGGNTSGGTCERPVDCGEGLACCAGYCLPDGICPFELCEVDSDCGDGLACCGGLIGCAPKGQCEALSGQCTTDGDCGTGAVCCDGACLERPFCEGECQSNGDCGGEQPFCCPGSGVDQPAYCSPSEGACFEGRSCDAGCGPSGALECCQQEGGGASCATAESCWSGRACTEDSACGGLICCDRSDLGVEARVCETPAVCVSYRACTTVADCNGIEGVVCCERGDFAAAPVCMIQAVCELY